MNFNKMSDEGLRLLANMETHYDTWLQARRVEAAGRLQWKVSGGREYLYRIVDRAGNGTSLGPRSEETERRMEAFQVAKVTVANTWARLQAEGMAYRAFRLPRIASYAGEVLRELDIERMLGGDVLVVGTNAMCTYSLEAQQLLDSSLDATEDFDLTWIRELDPPAPDPRRPSLFGVLKQLDSTYTINTERSFQARNSHGQEVELLVSEKLKDALPRFEQLRPIPLPEQDWLLPGHRISHVVCGFDNLPARVVAPDPRWFALHKLWLADKAERNPLKKGKDRAQGETLLELVDGYMPHFPLDDDFAAGLPAELLPYFEAWRDQRPAMKGP